MRWFDITPEMYEEFNKLRKLKPNTTVWTLKSLTYNIQDHPEVCPNLLACASVRCAAKIILETLTPEDKIKRARNPNHSYYVLEEGCQ